MLEPTFPGASGDYLALPVPKGTPELKEKYPALLALNRAAKLNYAQAYRLIEASAKIDEYITAFMREGLDIDRLVKRAQGIASREIPKKGGVGQLRRRFIDGITPKGRLCLYETIDAMAERIYEIQDNYDLSALLLEPILNAAVNRGYVVYGCYCPKTPERLLHLAIPELSLAFISTNADTQYGGTPFRRIRLDASVPPEKIRHLRGKVKLLRRISRSLIDDAVAEIASAHSLHDRIEDIYRPHIDIEALNRTIEAFVSAR